MADVQSLQGNLSDLARLPVGRLLWAYSAPAVVGMAVNSLYNVIDRVFIGQGVGPDAITGLTITFPVMNVAVALGTLVGVGMAARMSIYLGAGDHRGAERTLGNALVLQLAAIALYLGAFAIWLRPILALFGADEASMPYAYEFMSTLLPGLAMSNLAFSFNNAMRASGYPRRAMFTMFIGAGVNLALAPVFIFWLGWGIRGAALATDIAMTVSAAFVMQHFFRKDSTVRFQPGIYRLRRHEVVAILSLGASPCVINFASCAINAIINVTLGRHGGNTAIAAAGIFTTYTSIMVVVVLGICQGLQPVIGYNYGAGLYGRLRRAFWMAVVVATAITALGSAGGLWAGAAIGRAFTTDLYLIGATQNALRLSMLAFWAVGFQVISSSLFMAIGRAGKAFFLGLVRQVIFLIPLLWWLPRALGLNGVWLSFPISDVLATAVTVAMVVAQLASLQRRALERDAPEYARSGQ